MSIIRITLTLFLSFIGVKKKPVIKFKQYYDVFGFQNYVGVYNESDLSSTKFHQNQILSNRHINSKSRTEKQTDKVWRSHRLPDCYDKCAVSGSFISLGLGIVRSIGRQLITPSNSRSRIMFTRNYTSTKSLRSYIFISVCLCVCK